MPSAVPAASIAQKEVLTAEPRQHWHCAQADPWSGPHDHLATYYVGRLGPEACYNKAGTLIHRRIVELTRVAVQWSQPFPRPQPHPQARLLLEVLRSAATGVHLRFI